MFDTRDLLSHSLRCHMKSRDPCFSVSRANSAPMRFKPKPSSGGRFGIEDAKERSFKGRFRLGIISSSSSVSGAGLLSKSTDPATKSRSNASLTKSVTAGCEARASGFFGCPMNLSSLQRNWRWRGSVTRLSTERRGTEPSRFARPPLIRPRFARPPSPARGEGVAISRPLRSSGAVCAGPPRPSVSRRACARDKRDETSARRESRARPR